MIVAFTLVAPQSLKRDEPAVGAVTMAARTTQSGPTEFWDDHLEYVSGVAQLRRGDTFSEPTYFDLDEGPVTYVSFREVEDNSGW